MKFGLKILPRCNLHSIQQYRFKCDIKHKPPWNILFFGTDNFSVYSLRTLLKEYRTGDLIRNLEVCTTLKSNNNKVLAFARKEKLRLNEWPVELSHNEFDVGLVVSFGHLIPRKIIDKFPLGMINVHASLLPRWRGAAPIIFSLANGDTVTGISIMKIKPKKFDEGEILMQKSIEVPNDMYMPELHQILGELGAETLLSCLKELPEKIENAKPQPNTNITYTTKIDSNFCIISWKKMPSIQIYNIERAVKGFMPVTTYWNGETIKLFNIRISTETPNVEDKEPGFIVYDKSTSLLKILCLDNKYILVDKIQLFKRKCMSAKDFNNGFLKKTPIENRFFK